MPIERRRIQLTVDEAVFRTLALDPETHGAVPVSAALARYAEHVGRATREIERTLTRPEWNAIADIMNGCADLWDYSGTTLSHLLCIRANVEDGHRLDGLGHKWFGEGAKGDQAIKHLLDKLAKMTEIQGDAVAAATRYFWQHTEPGEIDHSKDAWWTLAYRTKERADG